MMNTGRYKEEDIFGVGLFWQISNGNILGVSRKHDHTSFGLPGGKVDKGEMPIDALIREIYEECGITIKKEDLNIIYERKDKSGKIFRTYDYKPTEVPEFKEGIYEENGGLAKWITWDDLITGEYGIYNYRLGIQVGRFLSQKWFISYVIDGSFYNKMIDVSPFVYINTLSKKILINSDVKLISFYPVDNTDYNTFKNQINNYAKI